MDTFLPTIYFRYTGDTYGYLSNFYHAEMVIDNVSYPHVEAFYQSQKFIDTDYDLAMRIAHTRNPKESKRLARSVEMSSDKRQQWNNGLRVTVMKKGVLHKFLTNVDLRDKLLSTGDSPLVEYAPHDNYWGDGRDGSGVNMLGKILMEVRSSLNLMYF